MRRHFVISKHERDRTAARFHSIALAQCAETAFHLCTAPSAMVAARGPARR